MLKLFVKKIDNGLDMPVTEDVVPGVMRSIGETGDIRVMRTDKGKPYVPDSKYHFSVTHSGDIWMLAISDSRIGIDFQYVESRDYEKISKRFYSEKDDKALRASDDEEGMFFDIWVRMEALGKYTGKGIFGVDKDVTDGARPLGVIDTDGEHPAFKVVGISDLEALGVAIERPFRCVILN